MTSPTESRRRPLTDNELAAIRQCIIDAPDTGTLISDAIRAVYTPLLADAGIAFDAMPDGLRINAAEYAIPTVQRTAIVDAISRRAEAWGTSALFVLDLYNLLPGVYDDPAVPEPDMQIPDYRPQTYHLQISRDAIDAIAAAEQHLYHLAVEYGSSHEGFTAATSWSRCMASLFSRFSGGTVRVDAAGPMSVLVRPANGLVYGIIWHAAPRRCADPSCAATIDDDGTAHDSRPSVDLAGHTPQLTYPLDATQPGAWSLHAGT
jgi:hypothetical protein